MDDEASPRRTDPRATSSPAATPLASSPFLPRLAAAAASGLTHAYARREPLRFTLGDAEYEASWRIDAAPAPGARGYRFSVAGLAHGTLVIDAAAEAAWLGDAADPAVPPIVRCALLADVFAPLLAAVQSLTRLRVELLPPPAQAAIDHAAAAASPAALRFALRRAASDWRCHGALIFDAPDVLGVFFPSPPAASSPQQAADGAANATAVFATLPVPLAFELGRTSLSARELADVEPGDIIAIERWLAQGKNLLCTARVRASPAWEIVGRPSGNQLVVERIRELPLESTQSNDPPLAHAGDPAQGPADASPRRLDGLAVDVAFQLPSCTMSLGELGALQPGAVIELQQGINQSIIDIVANGTRIGEGHLVAVGQKLGVRVTALTPPATSAPRERQDG